MNLLSNKVSGRETKMPGKIHTLQLGDESLLFGGIVTASLASMGVAGFVWSPIRPITDMATMFAMGFGPAFLLVSLKDTWRFGWARKRTLAIALTLFALAMVGLAFHEVISASPFLRQN